MMRTADCANVSRETSALRRYSSPFRRSRGLRTRQALIDAALAEIAEGAVRPEAGDVARRAGVHQAALTRHFGGLARFHRLLAQERPEAVAATAGFGWLPLERQRDLAWSILVGRVRRHDGREQRS